MSTARTATAVAAILLAALVVSTALPALGVPVWASVGLAALLGVAAGAPIGVLVSRRLARPHWARESAGLVLDSYLAVGDLATRLANLAVWPVGTGDATQLAAQLRREATLTRLRPDNVRDTAAALVAAAAHLAGVIDEIRTTSRPGRDNRVDDRLVGRHQAAVDELHTAYEAFVAAARVDLGVPA